MPRLELPQSSTFATDIFKLVTGTTIAQVITILASPFITRLYGPEAFGFLALFTSITSIIGVIACMRYEQAILLPKDDNEATNLLGLCFLCVISISVLTIPILYFGGEALLSLLRAPGLAPFLIVIPPFILINGVFLALNFWNSRTRHFGRLSVARVTSSLATTGTQLGAGFVGLATGGSLIGANLIGSSVSTGVLGGQIWRDDRRLLQRSISWKGMLDSLKRYKKFPLIDSGSTLLNSISWQLPAFLLAAFFSPVIVGFYSLSFMLLQIPMNLIGTAIAQVFFQRAAELEHGGNLAPFVEGVFQTLLAVGVFPMLILTVVGEDLFQVVFGLAWAEAGVYAQILSVWAIFWFISSPLTTIYLVKGRQEFGLKMNITIFLTRLVALIMGGLLGSPIAALLFYSGSGALVYGYLCYRLLRLCGVVQTWIVTTMASVVSRFIPAGMILIALKLFGFSPIIITVSATALVGLYYIYIIKTDINIRQVIPDGVKKLLLIKY